MANSPMIYPVQPQMGGGFGFDWNLSNIGPASQPTFDSSTLFNNAPTAGGPAGGGGFMNSLSNAWNNNPMGVIGQGVSAFNTLAQIYSSFKALDLAEDQFSFQKKAWNKNYNNQVKDYENQLKSRWAARDSAAKARGQEFESMSSWVGDRRLTGT